MRQPVAVDPSAFSQIAGERLTQSWNAQQTTVFWGYQPWWYHRAKNAHIMPKNED